MKPVTNPDRNRIITKECLEQYCDNKIPTQAGRMRYYFHIKDRGDQSYERIIVGEPSFIPASREFVGCFCRFESGAFDPVQNKHYESVIDLGSNLRYIDDLLALIEIWTRIDDYA